MGGLRALRSSRPLRGKRLVGRGERGCDGEEEEEGGGRGGAAGSQAAQPFPKAADDIFVFFVAGCCCFFLPLIAASGQWILALRPPRPISRVGAHLQLLRLQPVSRELIRPRLLQR